MVRTLFIRGALAAAVLAVAWVFGGRQVTLFLDRFFTVRIVSLPVTPLTYYSGTFQIGERTQGIVLGNYQRLDLRIDSDSRGGLVLSNGGKSFPLGASTIESDMIGGPRYVLAPGPGDQITYTIERSALSWPTPFDFNFMTGVSPSWKRHLYYRLLWKSANGARLRVSWRYEQWFYQETGWSSLGGMTSLQSNGQIQMDIDGR